MSAKVYKSIILFFIVPFSFCFQASAMSLAQPLALIAHSDVNADGYTDVFVSFSGSSGVGVMLGDGLGGFGNGIVEVYQVNGEVNGLQLVSSQSGVDSQSHLYINYFDSATYMDYWTSSLLAPQAPHIGVGMPSAMPQATVTGDLNGDSYTDSIYNSGNQVILALGQSSGGYSVPQVLIANSQYLPLDVADANGDGNMDILFHADFSHFIIYYGDGSGSFVAGNTGVGQAKSFIDINHDPYADIVSVYQDIYAIDKYEVIMGDATQSFSNRMQSSIESNYTTSMFVTDLNVDSYSDLVVAEQGFLSAYLGDGTGSFVRGHSYDIQGNLPVFDPTRDCGGTDMCTAPICLSVNTPWSLIGLGLFILALVSLKPKCFQASR